MCIEPHGLGPLVVQPLGRYAWWMPETHWPGLIELGRRVVEARNRATLSREDLANLAGMDVSNLGRIERGLVNPSFLTLVRIASSLDMDVGELVGRIGKDMLPPSVVTFSAREFREERERRIREGDDDPEAG